MEDKRKKYQTHIYVDGNTVRKMEAAPDYQREQEEKRRQETKKHNAQTTRRNREKATHMSKGYVAFLTVAVMITAFVSVTYIQLQSEVTSHLKTVSSLESQVVDLKADNDATLKRINTSVDLNNIKDVAMNQLGMVYAGENQIVYYSVDEDDYMNQYSDIPNN